MTSLNFRWNMVTVQMENACVSVHVSDAVWYGLFTKVCAQLSGVVSGVCEIVYSEIFILNIIMATKKQIMNNIE